jgi:hypothetical protein
MCELCDNEVPVLIRELNVFIEKVEGEGYETEINDEDIRTLRKILSILERL